MSSINWPTLFNWVIQGTISLGFGLIGGYVGAWLQFRFARRLEQERARDDERRAFRARLTEGVSEMMEKAERAALDRLAALKRFSLNVLVLLLVIAAFSVWWYAGLAALFVLGALLGAQARA